MLYDITESSKGCTLPVAVVSGEGCSVQIYNKLLEHCTYLQGVHEVVGNQDNSTVSEHDPHFEPIITLPEVTVSTMEENEIEMIKLLVSAHNVAFRFLELFLLFLHCKISNHCTTTYFTCCFYQHLCS
jgi:hypothetical protein